MRVAVLSDTHGNVTSFEAVLADICSRAVDRVVHLGDVIGKGPRGSVCCDLARSHCDAVVMGNWDVFILLDPAGFPSDALRWWRAELSDVDLAWLGGLPYSIDLSLGGKAIRAYHASADSVEHRIFPSVNGAEWDALFRNTPATGQGPEPDVVVYGDIHYAYEKTEGEHILINCGSVGNPFDETSASYLILDDETGSLRWQLIRVPYDIEAELAVARQCNMPAYNYWEHMLRTATVPEL